MRIKRGAGGGRVNKEGIKFGAIKLEENSRRELGIYLGGNSRREFNTFSVQKFLFLARFLFISD